MDIEELVNNSEEEVIKGSTIRFPRGLTFKEGEQLLKYIASYLPADVDYVASYHKSFIHELENQWTNEVNSIGPKTYNIRGKIISRKKAMAFDSFEGIFDITNEPFMGIKFTPIPGYNLNEHRKEVIELWDDVRNLIRIYFETHKKH